ncbi:uncharacterized protein LOC112268555 [Brachypodium distachyon]|uniref:F-box associated beta-propeller type 3 domain-containing protein n=1 Tax=Brachypodium distachyon TaxID=15368 RepID=A0A0Q3IQ63_BRADI|nr:uncharacterized protein LOC112268555 [Brachypodium distachyon]KQK02388.1 hypothetical protein BRADI_2g01140v3 [Brachypodium distachyon]|eukprot:XP_024315702.1 uncharacterized protein LOC112268555 [Brachypodium distachyon]
MRPTPAVRRPVLGFKDYSPRRGFTIHASCDGLLLLSLGNHRFYLCNPATRQSCALPDLTGCNVAALYPHRPSGEYRVLYSKHSGRSSDDRVYHVLTVSSSGGPRCIGLPLENAPRHWFVPACQHQPVLLHDCLHWHLGRNCSDSLVGKVVVFDTVLESFRLMQSPIASRSVHLLQMDGTLGIRHIDHAATMTELWVLRDYEMEGWSLKYRAELCVADMREHITDRCILSRKVVSENGDMLVTGSPSLSYHLLHCDSNGKLLEKYQWQGVATSVLGLCFKESLIRHAFFQRKDGSRVRVPRFFRGL